MGDGQVLTLRPPRFRVGRRFVLWQTMQALIGAVVVLGVLGAVLVWFESTRGWLGPITVVLAVGLLVDVTVMPSWRYRVHRWEVTGDAVYALEGWISRKWQIVPISRIQHIDTEVGPLQRLLGLATVTVTTASSEGKITIVGLDLAVAEETVERLREITAATPGDAT